MLWTLNLFHSSKGTLKSKEYKRNIYKVLIPFAWHQLRQWNCCMPEDVKNEIKKLWDDASSAYYKTGKNVFSTHQQYIK